MDRTVLDKKGGVTEGGGGGGVTEGRGGGGGVTEAG